MDQLVEKLLSALMLAASFAVLRILFRCRELETTSAEEIEELGEQFAKWLWIGFALILWYLAVGAYLSFEVLNLMTQRVAASLEPFRYLLIPNDMYRWIVSGSIAYFFATVMTYLSLRLLLAERYREYVRYSNLRYRFNIQAVAWVFTGLNLVVAALLVVGALNTYLVLREDQVVLQRPWWKQPKVYNYTQVKGLVRLAKYRSPIGMVRPSSYAAMRFDDGETWISETILYRTDQVRSKQIFEFLAAKTGKTLERFDLIENWKP
jgi:hypothetical protein